MLNTMWRSSGLVGGWLSGVAIIVAASVAMGANLSTSALLLVLGVAPGMVMAALANGAPSPTVAEILHAVEMKDGRS